MKGTKTLSARTTGLMKRLSVLTCIALLLISAGPLTQRALAQRTQAQDSVRVRVEGYLKATSPQKWLVGDHFIMLNEQTSVIEKRGQAEVGAWVIAWCLRDDAGTLYGEVIQVDRPAGASGPDIQFSGQVMKQRAEWWVIGELPVHITANTQITGSPGLNWLVWVVAENRDSYFEALAIEAIAEAPDLLPVEFEGVIEALEPGGGRINGRTFTLAANPEIIGTLSVGCTVEMRATLASNDILVARLIRVVAEPTAADFSAVVTGITEEESGGQTWDVALQPEQADAGPTPGILRIGPDTLVDESHAVAQIGMRAEIRGTEIAQGEIRADSVRLEHSLPDERATATALAAAAADHTENQLSAQAATAAIAPWSSPSPIASGLTNATDPVLAYTNDGITHALWESNRILFYAYRLPGSSWSRPQEIAAGFNPVLVVDSDGRLHAIFANEFTQKYNIFHCQLEANTWTLPINISRTSGRSEKPVVAAGAEGKLYAAWMDNTPGEWTTYSATWSGGFWSNQPLSSGRGQAPAIAVTPDNRIFIAWQDRVPTLDNPTGTFDIFVSERRTETWSIPVNVSDSGARDAIGVSLATSADGLAQLVWIEDGTTVRYGYGQGDSYWPKVQTVAHAPVTARGVCIVVEDGETLHIAWDEGAIVRAVSAPKASISWPKPEVIAALQGEIKDIGLVVGNRPGADVTLIWVQVSQPETVEVYESHRGITVYQRLWLPLIRHSQW